jgi:hypothetical protein
MRGDGTLLLLLLDSVSLVTESHCRYGGVCPTGMTWLLSMYILIGWLLTCAPT